MTPSELAAGLSKAYVKQPRKIAAQPQLKILWLQLAIDSFFVGL